MKNLRTLSGPYPVTRLSGYRTSAVHVSRMSTHLLVRERSLSGGRNAYHTTRKRTPITTVMIDGIFLSICWKYLANIHPSIIYIPYIPMIAIPI